jgi:RimJ/RimL family protein N-acetyltransferase
MAVRIRPLDVDDWKIFRDIRLTALRTEPTLFISTFEREAAFDEDRWRDWVAGPSKCMFGLFDGEEIIGLTGVVTLSEDPACETAMLVASFILPAYRGHRYSRLFYDARLEWVRQHTVFRRVVVSHRAGNEPSRRAVLRAGFSEIERIEHVWPDGSTDPRVMYELLIPREGDHRPPSPAID